MPITCFSAAPGWGGGAAEISLLLQTIKIHVIYKYFCVHYSIEKLYNHIKKTSQPALQPLIITQSGGNL
jgi:hypothetical protein